MGFPCNQFGRQEPGTNAEIQQFAKNKGANFPVFAKIETNGKSAHPLYKWLKKKSGAGDLTWNFAKFIISADGGTVEFHGPDVSSLSLRSKLTAMVKGQKREL